MAGTPNKAIKIFICYAREDEVLLKGLEKQLIALQRQGIIEPWYDRAISPGEDWAHEIDIHLNSAQIIILLISPDFMASDYCYGVEMKRAMERHELGEARVVPVILRPVYWIGAPFGSLQVLPTDAKPVISATWHSPDEAFYDVALGICSVVDEFARLFSAPPPTPLREIESSLQTIINNLPSNPQNLSEMEVRYIREQLASYAHLVDNWAQYTREKWRTVSDSQLGWKPLRGRWSGWEDIFLDSYPTSTSDPLYPATKLSFETTSSRFNISQEKGSAAAAVVCFLRDLDTLQRCIEFLLGTMQQLPATPVPQYSSQLSLVSSYISQEPQVEQIPFPKATETHLPSPQHIEKYSERKSMWPFRRERKNEESLTD